MPISHERIVEAFTDIYDKNALAWSILDTKSELAVTSAIAISANRKANRIIANVEYKKRDLAFINDNETLSLYEAKAAYFTDFQPNRIARNDWYLGKCIDEDFVKLRNFAKANPNVRDYSCLFYLYENSKPHLQSKYGNYPLVNSDSVFNAVRSQVKLGTVSNHQTIDCGTACDANIKIHLFIFDPK